jgi:hypothetical protein
MIHSNFQQQDSAKPKSIEWLQPIPLAKTKEVGGVYKTIKGPQQ